MSNGTNTQKGSGTVKVHITVGIIQCQIAFFAAFPGFTSNFGRQSNRAIGNSVVEFGFDFKMSITVGGKFGVVDGIGFLGTFNVKTFTKSVFGGKFLKEKKNINK